MKGQLSDQTIITILNDPRSSLVVAADHGISSALVRRIRGGKSYAKVHPEIPRFQRKTSGEKSTDACTEIPLCTPEPQLTCEQCIHWQWRECDLEFPEPKRIGLRFATWCAAFHDGSG